MFLKFLARFQPTFNSNLQLRILQDEKLKKMPPLCNEYVLAGVAIDERYQGKVKKLHDMIINKNFHLVLLAEVRKLIVSDLGLP